MHSVISRTQRKANIRRRITRNDDIGNALRRGRISCSEEGHMCPACIASTAVMVAGLGSAGGILAVCIGKLGKFFQKTKEK